MSKEKQIEEMAKVIERACEKECISPVNCDVCKAISLYNAGYRKQSEPISCIREKGGEWEQYGLRNPQCSLCHKYNIEKSNFCPSCGAKMKEE